LIGREAAPVIREKKITGMTIIFNMPINTDPNGEI